MSAGSLPVGLAGIPLVTDHGPWFDVGTDVHQDRHVRRIGCFTTGEVEGDRIAIEVCFQVDYYDLGTEKLSYDPVPSNFCTGGGNGDNDCNFKLDNTGSIFQVGLNFHF